MPLYRPLQCRLPKQTAKIFWETRGSIGETPKSTKLIQKISSCLTRRRQPGTNRTTRQPTGRRRYEDLLDGEQQQQAILFARGSHNRTIKEISLCKAPHPRPPLLERRHRPSRPSSRSSTALPPFSGREHVRRRTSQRPRPPRLASRAQGIRISKSQSPCP